MTLVLEALGIALLLRMLFITSRSCASSSRSDAMRSCGVILDGLEAVRWRIISRNFWRNSERFPGVDVVPPEDEPVELEVKPLPELLPVAPELVPLDVPVPLELVEVPEPEVLLLPDEVELPLVELLPLPDDVLLPEPELVPLVAPPLEELEPEELPVDVPEPELVVLLPLPLDVPLLLE